MSRRVRTLLSIGKKDTAEKMKSFHASGKPHEMLPRNDAVPGALPERTAAPDA
ncbi:hypothetical protein CBM2634_B160050 [Cupriavidus taiwanensis]|uniref:Uncharacterized protein n=1 Tax=Cupriavidus taiwanensis TaxID=164546 RepID=A0A375J4T5_9BURK|nr:hypothetical protein CBM2634_B160050 [Cupriavidus taiwanensis]